MTISVSDVHVAMPLPTVVVKEVRPEDIKLVALILRDPNPIHYDLNAVARAGLGEHPVNQGGSTMAYVMNLLVSWAGSRSAVRSIRCRFRANVCAGDDVEVGGIVTSVETTCDGLLVGCDVWADVVGGGRAIAGEAVVLLPPAAR